jgi:hypothetical protein
VPVDPSRIRQIIVTELKKLSEGTRNGTPWVIYQVRATLADGRVIQDMKLRTFEDLPTSQVISVEVEPFESPQYGKSYTLHQLDANNERINKRTKGSGQRRQGGGGVSWNAHNELEKRLNHLQAWAIQMGYTPITKGELEGNGSQPAEAAPVAAGPSQAAPQDPMPNAGNVPLHTDDDVPF